MRIRDKLKNAFINTLYKDQLGLPTTFLRLRIPLKVQGTCQGEAGLATFSHKHLIPGGLTLNSQLDVFQRERQWLLLMAQATL